MHSSRSSMATNFGSPNSFRHRGPTKTDAKSVAYKTLANEQSGFISFIVAISDYSKYAHGRFSHTPRAIQRWFEDGGVVESTFDIADSDGQIARVLLNNIGCSLEFFRTTSNSISLDPCIRIADGYDLPVASIAIITRSNSLCAFELLVFPIGPAREHLWLPIDLKKIHRHISTAYEPRIITSTDRRSMDDRYSSGDMSPSKIIARQQEILFGDESESDDDATTDVPDYFASETDPKTHSTLASHLASSAFDEPDAIPSRRAEPYAIPSRHSTHALPLEHKPRSAMRHPEPLPSKSHQPFTIANLSSPTGRSTIPAVPSSPHSQFPIFGSPFSASSKPRTESAQYRLFPDTSPGIGFPPAETSRAWPSGPFVFSATSATATPPTATATTATATTAPPTAPTTTTFPWATTVPTTTTFPWATTVPTTTTFPCFSATEKVDGSVPAPFCLPTTVPTRALTAELDIMRTTYGQVMKRQLEFVKSQLSSKQTMMLSYDAYMASIQQTIEMIKHQISLTDSAIAQMLPIAEMVLVNPTSGSLDSINRYCADEKRKNDATIEIKHNREKIAILEKLLLSADAQKTQFGKFISDLTSEITGLNDNVKALSELYL